MSVEHGVGHAESKNVNCITAKEMVKKCDAKCPVGLEAALTIKGQEVRIVPKIGGLVALIFAKVGRNCKSCCKNRDFLRAAGRNFAWCG